MRRTAFVSLIFALMSVPSGAAAQAPGPPQPTIAVNGTGRVERTPDFVEVSLAVETQQEEAGAAQAAAEKTMGAMIEAVKALSLPGQSLQPGTVELRPQYDDHRNYELPR